MDLSFSTQHEAFRKEVRDWIAANLDRTWGESLRDPAMGERELIEVRRAWQRKLNAGGYLGMRWPKEWGGRGATGVEEAILAEELAQRRRSGGSEQPRPHALRARADPSRHRGAAPPLHSRDAQRRRDLVSGLQRARRRLRPRLACAAAPSSRAITSSSTARSAGRPTARTPTGSSCSRAPNPDDRYGGISFILVDLDTPGVEVRPLKQITGESEFGEVFFENATRAAREPRRRARPGLADRDDGARLRARLADARLGGASSARSAQPRSSRARARPRRHGDAREARQARRRLAGVLLERVSHARQPRRRQGARARSPRSRRCSGASSTSDCGSPRSTCSAPVRSSAARIRGRASDVDWPRDFLWSRAESIFSGSNEIQRNIIAKRVLNLPQG